MLNLRIARRDDAQALAALAEQTFRETFAAANTQADMDLHCRSHYGAAIQAAEIADPGGLTLLGEDGGVLVGYVQLRWGPAPACVVAARPGEISRFYLRADWHGRGLAQRLMQACLDALLARQSDVAWLGVWEHNPRAIAFYRKFGFVTVGEHRFQLGSDPQRDLVMQRALAG